jgi:hypothetical protein
MLKIFYQWRSLTRLAAKKTARSAIERPVVGHQHSVSQKNYFTFEPEVISKSPKPSDTPSNMPLLRVIKVIVPMNHR